MSEGNSEYNPAIYSAMQVNTPYKSYKKTVLGKIYVNLIDPFSGNPTGYIIEGNPERDDSCILDVWSEKEDAFFRRMNKKHFETGMLIFYERPVIEEPKERTIEEYSDEELKEIVSQKFYAIQAQIRKAKSPVVLARMAALAKELDRSNSIINLIENSLAKLQEKPYIEQEE